MMIRYGDMIMSKIEFHARIKNGAIEIPGKYRDKIQDEVFVILQTDDNSDYTTNLIDQLLENPRECSDFQPLSREDIYERE